VQDRTRSSLQRWELRKRSRSSGSGTCPARFNGAAALGAAETLRLRGQVLQVIPASMGPQPSADIIACRHAPRSKYALNARFTTSVILIPSDSASLCIIRMNGFSTWYVWRAVNLASRVPWGLVRESHPPPFPRGTRAEAPCTRTREPYASPHR
jgi:hypothetical protein